MAAGPHTKASRRRLALQRQVQRQAQEERSPLGKARVQARRQAGSRQVQGQGQGRRDNPLAAELRSQGPGRSRELRRSPAEEHHSPAAALRSRVQGHTLAGGRRSLLVQGSRHLGIQARGRTQQRVRAAR